MPGLYENLLGQDLSNMLFNVAGGQQDVENQQWAQLFAAAQRQFGLQQGSTTLDQLINLRRDPSSPGGILGAAGQLGGGGTLGQLGALDATGGQGFPTFLSPIIQRIIEEQSVAAGGAPINPNTGRPFDEQELAYIRSILGQQGQVPTGGVDPTTGFAAYGPATAAAAQPQAPTQAQTAGTARPQTETLAQEVQRIRQGSANKRAGRFLNGSGLSPTKGKKA